jgi:hypothetical protein
MGFASVDFACRIGKELFRAGATQILWDFFAVLVLLGE